MFRRSPFKDAEKNPEPPERSLLDLVGLFFAFIWFYNKVWIGIILVCGVGYLIHYLTTQSQNIDKGESKPGAPFVMKEGEPIALPSAKIEMTSSEEPEDAEPAKIQRTKIKDLLETGSIDELVTESLNIRDKWGQEPPAIAFMMNSDRLKVSQRLLELEVSDSQRAFANVSYIEALSILDSLNIRHQFKTTGIAEALNELDTTLANHPDQTIASKSHLAITLSPANKFYYYGGLNHLRQFEAELESRLGSIMAETSSLDRLCQIMVRLKNKSGFENDSTPVAFKLLASIQNSDVPEIKSLAGRYKQHLIFDHLELGTFIRRITIDDNLSRAQVQELFQALADNPDSGSQPYQAAVDSIKAYHAMEKHEDATALLTWLKQIAGTIPIEKNKSEMQKALSKLEEDISVRQ